MLNRARTTVFWQDRWVHDEHTTRKGINHLIRYHFAKGGNHSYIEALRLKVLQEPTPFTLFFEGTFKEERDLLCSGILVQFKKRQSSVLGYGGTKNLYSLFKGRLPAQHGLECMM